MIEEEKIMHQKTQEMTERNQWGDESHDFRHDERNVQCHIEAREDDKRLSFSGGKAESGTAFLPLSVQPI